jgi:hypothetical protein
MEIKRSSEEKQRKRFSLEAARKDLSKQHRWLPSSQKPQM